MSDDASQRRLAELFAVSLRIVRERSLAEEVLQDSFVSISGPVLASGVIAPVRRS